MKLIFFLCLSSLVASCSSYTGDIDKKIEQKGLAALSHTENCMVQNVVSDDVYEKMSGKLILAEYRKICDAVDGLSNIELYACHDQATGGYARLPCPANILKLASRGKLDKVQNAILCLADYEISGDTTRDRLKERKPCHSIGYLCKKRLLHSNGSCWRD